MIFRIFKKSPVWAIVGSESFLQLKYRDEKSGKRRGVYERQREKEREKERVTLVPRGNPWPVSSYFFVQLCLSTLEREEGRVMGLEILTGPMRRERGRERCIHYLLSSDCIRRCIHYLSFSERNRTIYISLASKLRENIRTMVDKLLTSSFCAGRDSRANIYKSWGSRIRFESPRWFFHKEGQSSNAQGIKYL